MPRPTLARFAATLRPARRPADVADTDDQLLSKFVQSRDESAFRALVHRHAKAVLTACQQVLTDPADIDDTFQATFLVLLKKAKQVDGSVPLGGWLFAVAHRLAVRCRSDKARRSAREAEAARTATARERVSPLADLSWREAAAVLHAELNGLPDRYRLPLLLCSVQGLTRDEAAEQLGTTVGAIRGQLERGRSLLERRLAKRGVVLSAGLLAVVLGSSSVAGGPPAGLIDLAVGAVSGHASATVAALAHGAFPMTTLLNRTLLGVLTVALFAAGVGLAPLVPTASADEKPAAEMKKPKADAKPDGKAEVTERTISGKVLGSDGKPVAAELLLVWFEAKPQPLGKANADGTFKVTVPMTASGRGGVLVAKAAGHAPDFTPHAFDYYPQSLTPNAEVTLKLPKERVIKGRVLDQEGKPVAGATVEPRGVSAFDSDATRDAQMKKWGTEMFLRGVPPGGDRWLGYSKEYPAAAVTTDKDGRYELAGFGAGQLVHLKLSGPRVATNEVITLNADGFDPAPTMKLTREHEYKEFGGRWTLDGPDPTSVLEPEKVIRGTVTGPDGKPRAGITVSFTRPNKSDLAHRNCSATTDKDGKYEIRGAKKHTGYMVEVPPDPAAGLLPCQGFADDSVGYEPVTIDLKCAKGVVLTGTVTNKATGKPVPAQMWVDVLNANAFVDKYPPFMHSGSGATDKFKTDADGKFRVVTVPGPVILMASPEKGDWEAFKPPVPDPKHPDRFTGEYGMLGFYAYGGGVSLVQGNWCRVIEAKETDTEVSVEVAFEPATKTAVKVVDADGKPLAGTHATGTTSWVGGRAVESVTDTHTLLNLEAKKERLVAVVQKEKKMVGVLTLTAETKDPVVKLGDGGTVTGRAVDAGGKPAAGLNVQVYFARRAVQEAFEALGPDIVTDANGEFRIAPVFPGEEFRLLFRKGNKPVGPDYDKAGKHSVEKHGDTLKLGDVKLEGKDGND